MLAAQRCLSASARVIIYTVFKMSSGLNQSFWCQFKDVLFIAAHRIVINQNHHKFFISNASASVKVITDFVYLTLSFFLQTLIILQLFQYIQSSDSRLPD